MKTFAQRLPLFALKFYQPMRDAILVEKIIELMSIARVAAGQNTHARKFAIATKPASSHDQRIDDRLAHGGNFRQRAPKFGRRNVKYLGLVRCDSGRTEDRCALEHRYVAHEITLARGSEVIFGAIARLEALRVRRAKQLLVRDRAARP